MKHISHFTKIIIDDIKIRYDKHRGTVNGTSADSKRKLQNRTNAKCN